jgi:hypothetical protein
MESKVETITPEHAAFLLEGNTENRRVRRVVVTRYAHDMREGNWMVTGQPIILNGDRLLDGQHRLMACVEAGVPFETMVVTGVDSSVMPNIDKGTPRRLSDTLRWQGANNATNVSTVARRICALLAGISLRETNSINAMSTSDFLDTYATYEEEIQSAYLIGRRIADATGRPVSEVAVAALWVMLNIGPDDRDQLEAFCSQLADGVGMLEGSSVLALRRWMQSSVNQRRRLRPDEMLIAFVKSWNAHLTGQTMKLVKVHPAEPLPEVLQP